MTHQLARNVRRALTWSTVSSLVLRLGTFATGILLARMLTPEQFGVYAIALAVQSVLMTLADLGLSADLIRSDEPEKIGPTVATLGLISGSALTAVMVASAPWLAAALGSPESTGVIVLLSVTLLLAGAGVVPYASLNRQFAQHKLFAVTVVDFVVSTAVTVGLVLSGWGVMALAVGRIAAQLCSLALQFKLSGERPRFGWNRSTLRPVLGFGLPVAAANLLSWALLNIDNVVISKLAGPVALGFYVLAFNISNWPMNSIGQAVRSVALPGFSRLQADEYRGLRSLVLPIALTWAVSLPAGVLLAVLAGPVISTVYGDRWIIAAPVLAALGLFGAIRTLFDLIASYLMAGGRSRAVLTVQAIWFIVLIPAVVAGFSGWGLPGAGWAHVGIALLVFATYLLVLRKAERNLRPIIRPLLPPILAAAPAAVLAHLASQGSAAPIVQLFFGGAAGTVCYGLLILPWCRRELRKASAYAAGEAAAASQTAVADEVRAGSSAIEGRLPAEQV